jgi:hypothetical protein
MNHFPHLKTSEGPISLIKCIIPVNLISTKQSTACRQHEQAGFILPTAHATVLKHCEAAIQDALGTRDIYWEVISVIVTKKAQINMSNFEWY